MTDKSVTLEAGASPLVLSMPHVGTDLPAEVAEALNETGRAVDDTDWHLHRLYDFAADLKPTVVRARISRYVIDVNRDPSGASLYPGQATTGLCPTTTFDGEPIYQPGAEPGEAEIARRRETYFAPYHATLRRAVDAARARHGYCLLYDCHSIRSVVPRLFPGRLPVFNIGTNDGASCAPEIRAAVTRACAAAGAEHDHVVDGRFKGGWITRAYGAPQDGVHAVQMELAMRAYMAREERPWDYDPRVADGVRPVLRAVLEAMLEAGADISGESR